MRVRTIALMVPAVMCGCWGLLHAQKPFREYDTVEGHAESAIPPDANVPHEWTRARLMYREYSGFGRFGFRGGGSWTIDYPLSDLDDKYQIPGAQYLNSGRTYEKDETGRPEHWRGIYDDKGRVVVAICH